MKNIVLGAACLALGWIFIIKSDQEAHAEAIREAHAEVPLVPVSPPHQGRPEPEAGPAPVADSQLKAKEPQ